MDITIQFARPPKIGVVKNFCEAVGLSKEPPLKCFGGQVFDQVGNCGSVRVVVIEARNRIVLSTD
ncbi:MAG: hypothetical protein MUP08_03090 [Desulfobulbaceae bacterium]|nr:hypothetical protein [Desulfobulbaceae bacterium]